MLPRAQLSPLAGAWYFPFVNHDSEQPIVTVPIHDREKEQAWVRPVIRKKSVALECAPFLHKDRHQEL
jgi:hypothetical protein